MSTISEAERKAREKAYLTGRWQNQYNYFSRRSAENKRRYQRLMLFVALAGVLIPVLVNLNIPTVTVEPIGLVDAQKILLTVLSLLVSAATVIETVHQHGEKWRQFRTTLEHLKRERALYDTRTGDYRDPETAFDLFVQRSESIIAEDVASYPFAPEQQEEGASRALAATGGRRSS